MRYVFVLLKQPFQPGWLWPQETFGSPPGQFGAAAEWGLGQGPARGCGDQLHGALFKLLDFSFG